MRVSVLGVGCLGTVHAACLAEQGHDVLAVDVDTNKLATLAAGRSHFFEPDLDELLAVVVGNGRLRFSSSYAEAAEHADLHFVCVGTPQRADSAAADLSQVWSCIDSLAPHLHRPTVVVGKSTVPVGTAALIRDRLAELAPVGGLATLSWNPEFLREGFAVRDTRGPDRIVVGLAPEGDDSVLREVYAHQLAAGVPYLRTDLQTAELVKVAANSFLATKISFINAMAIICDEVGADVTTLAEAIGYDDRIGPKFLRAGIGFGGGCLPKDIRAFHARAAELGVGAALGFLAEVETVNLAMRQRVIDTTLRLLGSSRGPVAILGAAFKPDSDDVRDSPALDIADALHHHGVEIRVYDPQAQATASRLRPHLDYADSLEVCTKNAEVVLLLTEWREFRDIDPVVLGEAVASKVIVDGRNVLDPTAWRGAGWEIHSIGRP